MDLGGVIDGYYSSDGSLSSECSLELDRISWSVGSLGALGDGLMSFGEEARALFVVLECLFKLLKRRGGLIGLDLLGDLFCKLFEVLGVDEGAISDPQYPHLRNTWCDVVALLCKIIYFNDEIGNKIFGELGNRCISLNLKLKLGLYASIVRTIKEKTVCFSENENASLRNAFFKTECIGLVTECLRIMKVEANIYIEECLYICIECLTLNENIVSIPNWCFFVDELDFLMSLFSSNNENEIIMIKTLQCLGIFFRFCCFCLNQEKFFEISHHIIELLVSHEFNVKESNDLLKSFVLLFYNVFKVLPLRMHLTNPHFLGLINQMSFFTKVSIDMKHKESLVTCFDFWSHISRYFERIQVSMPDAVYLIVDSVFKEYMIHAVDSYKNGDIKYRNFAFISATSELFEKAWSIIPKSIKEYHDFLENLTNNHINAFNDSTINTENNIDGLSMLVLFFVALMKQDPMSINWCCCFVTEIIKSIDNIPSTVFSNHASNWVFFSQCILKYIDELVDMISRNVSGSSFGNPQFLAVYELTRFLIGKVINFDSQELYNYLVEVLLRFLHANQQTDFDIFISDPIFSSFLLFPGGDFCRFINNNNSIHVMELVSSLKHNFLNVKMLMDHFDEQYLNLKSNCNPEKCKYTHNCLRGFLSGINSGYYMKVYNWFMNDHLLDMLELLKSCISNGNAVGSILKVWVYFLKEDKRNMPFSKGGASHVFLFQKSLEVIEIAYHSDTELIIKLLKIMHLSLSQNGINYGIMEYFGDQALNKMISLFKDMINPESSSNDYMILVFNICESLFRIDLISDLTIDLVFDSLMGCLMTVFQQHVFIFNNDTFNKALSLLSTLMQLNVSKENYSYFGRFNELFVILLDCFLVKESIKIDSFIVPFFMFVKVSTQFVENVFLSIMNSYETQDQASIRNLLELFIESSVCLPNKIQPPNAFVILLSRFRVAIKRFCISLNEIDQLSMYFPKK